jgi:hypothetical protein
MALAVLTSSSTLYSQKFDAGIQLNGVHLHKIDEGPVGIGGRFHYNVAPWIGIDAEITHYPENPSGNFGETAGLFGVRGGAAFDRFGIFGKAGAGMIHFGGQYFTDRLTSKTFASSELGGMLEYYPSRRTFLRVELTDLLIYYGNARLFNRPNPDPLGSVHNALSSLGFGFRF